MSLQDIEVPVSRLYDELNAFKSKYDTGYLDIIKFLTYDKRTFKDKILDDTPGYKAQVKALTPLIIELKNGFRGEETFYSHIINQMYDILSIILDKLKSYNGQADITDEMCNNLVKINTLKKKFNDLLRELENLKESVRGIDNMVSKLFSQIKSPLGGMGRNDIKQIIENQERLIGEHEGKLPDYNRTLLARILPPNDEIDKLLVSIQKKCGSKVRFTDGNLMKVMQFSAQEGLLGSPNIQMLLMHLCKSTNYKYPIGLSLWKTIIASEKDGDNTVLMRAAKNQRLDKIQFFKAFPRLNPLIMTNGETALTLACTPLGWDRPPDQIIIKDIWTTPLLRGTEHRKNQSYRNAFLTLYQNQSIYQNIDLLYWILFKVDDVFKINFNETFLYPDHRGDPIPTQIVELILFNTGTMQRRETNPGGFLHLLLYKNYDIFQTNGGSPATLDRIKEKPIHNQIDLLSYAASGAFNDNSPLFSNIITELIMVVRNPDGMTITPRNRDILLGILSKYILPVGSVIDPVPAPGLAPAAGGGGGGGGAAAAEEVINGIDAFFTGIISNRRSGTYFTSNLKVKIVFETDEYYQFHAYQLDHIIYRVLKSQCTMKVITHKLNLPMVEFIIAKKFDTNSITQAEINALVTTHRIPRDELLAYLRLYNVTITEQGGGYYNKFQKYSRKYNLL